MKVAVIGAGASGLLCAGFLAKKGYKVYVFESNEKAGKKLYITGKGRCNFTNTSTEDEFSKNIVRGQKFLFSALSRFNSQDVISFFEEIWYPNSSVVSKYFKCNARNESGKS